MDGRQDRASGPAADNDHPDLQQLAGSPGKSIRFFEYASVIPQLDPEQLHEHVVQVYGPQGRPHLSSRTYSVPIPSSITSLFASPPPREFTYDPSFIPNSPPRLNLKLPSFVRKRRNTIVSQSPLKPILKNRRVIVATTIRSAASVDEALPADKISRGRSHTLASSAPASAPSASCSISNINPVYCPALARVIFKAEDAQTDSAGGLSTSPPPASQISSSPPKADSSAFTVGSPTQSLSPEATELLPIRDCCRACRKAATYGEKCTDSTYYEKWSKAAKEKRKRDEETKFERGEFISHDDAAREKVHISANGVEGSHEAGSDVVHEVEKLEKEEAKHHHGLHSPAHSPLDHNLQQSSSTLNSRRFPSPHQPTGAENTSHTHSPPLPPLLAHVHGHIQACQEAKREKQDAHQEEIVAARERIARLDIGKKFTKHEEEEDNGGDSPCSDEQEGNDLQLEGINDDTGGNSPPSSGQGEQNASRQPTALGRNNEYEKNPICTLDGQILRPCSSNSLYTGGPSFRSPGGTTPIGFSTRRDSDQASTASSSDRSDDLLSTLSSLGLSPASATTNASSWSGGEDLSSPPEPLLKEGRGENDYFSSKGDAAESSTQTDAARYKKEAGVTGTKAGTGCSPLTRTKCLRPAGLYAPLPIDDEAPATKAGTGCSPLTRTKCLRPAGLYAPLPVDDEAILKTCPTIDEESLPCTSTGATLQPSHALRGNNATPITSANIDQEADFREALKDADKPVFTRPVRTQSSPAYSGGRGAGSNSLPNSPVENEDVEGNKQQRTSWARRMLHPGRAFSALGIAHGVVQ